MSERNYLPKVLALSAGPRLLTFGLTAVSFPLMVRSLGPHEYGVFVFVSSIVAILESFLDFGVSSAAGKNVAAARAARPDSLRREVLSWSQLQGAVAALGLIPVLGVTYVITASSLEISVDWELISIVVVAAWVTIASNFSRATLTSLLAFKATAALDTSESVLRSGALIAIAYLLPSALGLALGTLFVAFVSALLAIFMLWRVLGHACPPNHQVSDGGTALRQMIRESGDFLWLRLATRAFQSIPLIMLGRMFGAELVGIVGAFARLAEILIFPFSVIGNALAVRVSAVVASGFLAIQALWDAASRFIAASVALAVTIYLGAGLVAQLLLKDTQTGPIFVSLLSITIVTSAVSTIVAPMSDYVGALRSRNTLLTACAITQIAAIWVGSAAAGTFGAVMAYVLVLATMNYGYIVIALRIFFPRSRYAVRFEVRYFLVVVVIALVFTLVLQHLLRINGLLVSRPAVASLTSVGLFWAFTLALLLCHSAAKTFFFSGSFLDFQAPRQQRFDSEYEQASSKSH